MLKPHHLQKINVSRETLLKLEKLFFWSEKCKHYGSFTNYKDSNDFWDRHVFDSLQLTQHINHSETILDIGSGGGFPGLVLSAAGYNVILSELQEKKRFFLKEAARLMGVNVQVTPNSQTYSGDFSVVTARAVTSLGSLIKLAPNVSRETRGLFLKGKQYRKELMALDQKTQDHTVIHKCDFGVIVEIKWN